MSKQRRAVPRLGPKSPTNAPTLLRPAHERRTQEVREAGITAGKEQRGPAARAACRKHRAAQAFKTGCDCLSRKGAPLGLMVPGTVVRAF